MDEIEKIKNLNTALLMTLDMEPLTEFREPRNETTSRMLYGLAQVYSNEGFREYIQHEIDMAMKATATRSVNLVDIAAGKARALTLKELLAKGRNAFTELQRIQNLANQKNAA